MGFSNKKVLVTGSGGFIGSHLTQQLVQHGAEVTAFLRYSSSGNRGMLSQFSKQEQDHIEIVFGDLKDPDSVRSAVKGKDIVFHLGALIAIPYSYQNPVDVFQTNLLGTMHVAQACRDYGVSKLLHTSTSEVYGTAQYVPMGENHPLQGQSPYSASKIAADKLIESFFCSYNLPVITVRPFNSYGPRQSMRAVIPTIINQALHREEIVLGNLTSTRDFTYVEDTAHAFMKAAESNAHGEVINAGSGFEVSIQQIVDQVLQIVGKDIPVSVDQARLRPEKSEVDRLFSDSSKAATSINWKPNTLFEDGLRKTIEWIQKHPDLYRPTEYVV